MIDDITEQEWNGSLRDFYEKKKSEQMMTRMKEAIEMLKNDEKASSNQVGVVIKDIPGYEGLYGVRQDGEIISYGNKSNHLDDKYLTPSYDKDGYKRVTLQKDKIRKYYRVCRLVAQAFCPNPNEHPVVNHIDKNKANDLYTNLEWVTLYENWKHSEDDQQYKEIAVVQYTKELDFVAEYQSLMEASRCTGINQGNISNCLAGKCKSVGGFVWKKK